MSKTVWMINHYAGNMPGERGGRHYWFAKYLQAAGEYQPVIFVCNIKHPGTERFFDFDGLWEEHEAEEIRTPFIYINARMYSDNGKERVLNMISFYRNMLKTADQYAKAHGKPDVILASSAHPLTMVAGIKIAKRFGIQCICEVRDLWPESIVAYKNARKDSAAMKALYRGEKWIYTKADQLIFTMEGAYDYIKRQGWEKDIPREKVHLINNGVDLEQYEENLRNYTVDDEDLNEDKLFKVIYTGSIRKANHIDLLVEAAKALQGRNIKILVWGSGEELEGLQQAADGLENIRFKGRVQKAEIPSVLRKGDALFLDAFDERVAQYGISSNKLFEYFAAGKPILMNRIPQYNPAAKHGCQIEYECTGEGVARAIEKTAGMDPDEYAALCARAGEAAREYSFRELTAKLAEVIKMTV